VGSVAFLPASAPDGQLGAFSSLFNGLLSKSETSFQAGLIPAATNQEQPIEFAALHAIPVSAKPKPKDATSRENDGDTGKKSEPKPKLALVQTTEAPPPMFKPPILFRALTWDTHPQSTQTPPREDAVDAAPEAHIGTAGTSTPLSSGEAVSSPKETGPAAAEGIAFGLQLTISHREASTSGQSSAPEPQAGLVVSNPLSNTLSNTLSNIAAAESVEDHRGSPQASSVRVAAEATLAAPNGSPIRNDTEPPVPDLSLASRAKDPSPMNETSPFVSAGSDEGGLDDTSVDNIPLNNVSDPKPATDISRAGGVTAARGQVASSYLTVSGKQPDSSRRVPPSALPQRPDRDSAAPALVLSRSSEDPEPENPQVSDDQNPLELAGKQKPAPENSSATNDGGPMPASASIPERTRPAAMQQQHTPLEELDHSAPAQNATRSEPVTKRDVESIHNESQESGVTAALEARPAQASGALDPRAERPGADPARTTSSQASSQPSSQASSSQLTPPQAISSQAIPFETTASRQPPASGATNAAIESETNATPQPPPARQISLKLTGDDSTKVSVDVSEKAGKVQVTVRTADPDLAKSLQGDLGDLVGRLESKGFKSEAWVPAASRHAAAAAPEQSGSTNSQGNPRHSGSGTEQRPGRQGQKGSNQRQQARWAAQLEQTLSTTEETGTNNQ